MKGLGPGGMMVASGAAAKGWRPTPCPTCGSPLDIGAPESACTAGRCRAPEREAAAAEVVAKAEAERLRRKAEALDAAQGEVAAALAALGVAPARALMVGDSVAHDVEGARAAGCAWTLVEGGVYEGEAQDAPDSGGWAMASLVW